MPPSAHERQDVRVLHEAAEWFAILSSGQVSDADRRRWEAWLGTPGSPQNQAWQRVECIGGRFEQAREPAAYAALHGSLNRRRQVLRSMLLLGGVGAGALMALQTRPFQSWTADYATPVGGLRDLVLNDGTQLWLNTDSAVDVLFSAARRELVLRHGEIHVQTAADASRPFVVRTPHGGARALGTRYNVRLTDERTEVAVYEGAVMLQPSGAGHAGLMVPAGDCGSFDRRSATLDGAAGAARQSWTRGLLVANDVPLGEFVEELSRYRRGILTCAPEVAALRLVGAFPANDSDAALDMITRTLPVRVRQRSPYWVTVVPANIRS